MNLLRSDVGHVRYIYIFWSSGHTVVIERTYLKAVESTSSVFQVILGAKLAVFLPT